MQELLTSQFWLGLGAIIWVNIILSGDNAVVIALAARSLPRHQQNKAIIWGAGAAVVLRIVLTIVAVELLKLSYLKLLGGALLFWIAVKLLVPEDGGGDGVKSSSNLLAAIKTILIADLVMSLDNVIAVAAVAKGSIVLLVLGLDQHPAGGFRCDHADEAHGELSGDHRGRGRADRLCVGRNAGDRPGRGRVVQGQRPLDGRLRGLFALRSQVRAVGGGAGRRGPGGGGRKVARQSRTGRRRQKLSPPRGLDLSQGCVRSLWR